ncbi:MAG TPA: addiction module protein [Kofleriaceae bacterium]|nr:addiction module protein [Kofleriaceae bacterium]
MAAVEKVLQEALALPREDRARLLEALHESLEPEDEQTLTEPEWEAAWTAEIDRRLRDFDEGRAKSIPYEQAMAQIRARLARP